MTISTHHAESVIKAYTKQQKTRSTVDLDNRQGGRQGDSVTLSMGNGSIDNKLEKISYTLIDILTRKKPPESD